MITVEEFEQISDLPENSERRLELVNGVIIEKCTTEWCGIIRVSVATYIYKHVDEFDLGRVALRPYHRVPTENYYGMLPDIAFTGNARLLPIVKVGSVPQMPDIVVEVKSPDNTYKLMRQKAEYYLNNQTKLVWLIFPEKKIVEVYKANQDVDIFINDGILSGENVLPDFTLSLAKIFDE